MLAPKGPTFNGRPTFANLMYLKKAQFEIPCLYAIPNDQYDPTNRLIPDREETLTLGNESRSKLNKDLVKPFDNTKLTSLYEIFKPPTQHYEIQFAHANEIRKKMWRKSFVRGKSVETSVNKNICMSDNQYDPRIPKPSVLGKPTPFSNSPEMRSFQTKQSVNKTNVSDGLFKQVTQQNLPQIRKQAVRNTNVIAPGILGIAKACVTSSPQGKK
ncbi:hypothetical protein Tco_0795850 [Tanacetum coccineum]